MTKPLTTVQQAILKWMAEDPFNRTIIVNKYVGTSHDGTRAYRYVNGRAQYIQRKTFYALRPHLRVVGQFRVKGWSGTTYALGTPPA